MFKRIHHSLVLALLVFTPAMTFGESSVPAYLLRSKDDAKAFLIDGESSPFLAQPSLIDSAEFRWNIDLENKKDNETSYELRIKPKAYGQREAEQKVLELRTKHHENTYEKALNNSLYKRYRRLLDSIDKRNNTRYLFQFIDLKQQETQFYRNLVQSKDFTARKLLDAEISLEKASGLATLQLSHLNFIQGEMGVPADTSTALLSPEKKLQFVSFPEIKKIMNQSLHPLKNPDVLSSRLDFKLEKLLSQSVKTQEKFGIDLLTFKYNENRGEDVVSFTVGVNIPIGGNFRSSKRFFDVREAESRLISRLASVERLLQDQRHQFHSLSLERNFFLTRIQGLEDRMSKPYAMNNPDLLFALKYEKISQEKELSSTKIKAAHLYLDFLNVSGMLAKPPLRNWIQAGQPLLSGE